MRIALIADDDEPFTLADTLRAGGHDVRILAAERVSWVVDADAVRAGPYRFSAASGEAFINERPVRLTARELDLALYLFRRIGQPLARAEIARQVWGHGPAIVSRTLDAHVCKLRRKLALGAANGFRLACLYGFGYRLEPAGKDRSSP